MQKEARRGVSWFACSERRAAKQRGEAAAKAEIEAERVRREDDHAKQQRR